MGRSSPHRSAEFRETDECVQPEVWRFHAGATEPERYTDVLPVRLGDRVIGEIQLPKIFDWPR